MNQLSPERERLFKEVEQELHFPAEVYKLGERFEGLPRELAPIRILDVTKIPGCHYGARNVFVPIIHHLEEVGVPVGKGKQVPVSPENAILVEPSTGNGWVAFSDAAERLGYEHFVVMPDGLPETRYKHPRGRNVKILKTPEQEYALGMPKAMLSLVTQNRNRFKEGKKIFVSPNHPVGGADITVRAMSDLGRQLLEGLGKRNRPLRVVLSMGNGSSLCAIGEYVKSHAKNAKVVTTESFAYGGGYDKFLQQRGYRYRNFFGIDPGHPYLMYHFSAWGTNAPIDIEMPLQTRAIKSGLIDNYKLFTDDKVLAAYTGIYPTVAQYYVAKHLPNYSKLPQVLSEKYGNSTLANIAVAAKFTQRGEIVVAMAYDGRENY